MTTYNNLFWRFEKHLDEQNCDRIVRNRPSEFEDAVIAGGHVQKEVRDASVSFLNEPELEQHIDSAMAIANHRAEWHFDISAKEPLQFIKYELNGHYKPHVDAGFDDCFKWHDDSSEGLVVKSTQDVNLLGKTRKISSIMLLNDEFEGGEVCFYRLATSAVFPYFVKVEEIVLPLEKGDLVVFPSDILHTVKPVTKGERYSIVTWHSGKRRS